MQGLASCRTRLAEHDPWQEPTRRALGARPRLLSGGVWHESSLPAVSDAAERHIAGDARRGRELIARRCRPTDPSLQPQSLQPIVVQADVMRQLVEDRQADLLGEVARVREVFFEWQTV